MYRWRTPHGRRWIRPNAASGRWTPSNACSLRESQVQPLLLVFEDLHALDAESQILRDGLVVRLKNRPGNVHDSKQAVAFLRELIDMCIEVPAEGRVATMHSVNVTARCQRIRVHAQPRGAPGADHIDDHSQRHQRPMHSPVERSSIASGGARDHGGQVGRLVLDHHVS
jgi:hypothetical protein